MPRPVPTVLSCTLLALALLLGAFHWGQATASSRSERRRTPVVEAVEHASPAVVNVYAFLRRRGARGAGAGAIVHPDGYVVTNSHVIRGARRIGVELFGRRGTYDARVVVDDPRGDLALLKLNARGRWPHISLAAPGSVMLGETAIAIGNPRGLGDTITVGVVSAVGRSAKVASGATLRSLIQTDASINTGNSGGPLLNLDGELIGINASILPSAKGIAFAISADQVRAMLTRALGTAGPPNPLPEVEPELPARPAPRTLEAPPLAAAPRASSERVARTPPRTQPQPPPATEATPAMPEREPLRPSDLGLHIRDDGRRLVVQGVTGSTPAGRGGLRSGDVLLDIDGLPVESETDVVLAFQGSFPGRRYVLTVRRGTQKRHLVVQVPE